MAVPTPSYMLCFASAMVVLTGRDENTAGYIAVTVGAVGSVGKAKRCPRLVANLV